VKGNIMSISKLTLLLTLLLIIVMAASAARRSELCGCNDPKRIAELILKLQANDWSTLSVERIQSIWPTPLVEITCQNPNGCRALVSQGRVINGHCECCEAFTFGGKNNFDGMRSEELKNMVLHYTNSNRTEIVNAARVLARAAGLSGTHVAGVGGEPVQRFEWKTTEQKLGSNSVLEVGFVHVQDNWELYFALTRENE
jgi:hypothetical protein